MDTHRTERATWPHFFGFDTTWDDGLDLRRKINQKHAISIIMLTARVEETDKLIGLELGPYGYVTKPFPPGSWSLCPAPFTDASYGRMSENHDEAKIPDG